MRESVSVLLSQTLMETAVWMFVLMARSRHLGLTDVLLVLRLKTVELVLFLQRITSVFVTQMVPPLLSTSKEMNVLMSVQLVRTWSMEPANAMDLSYPKPSSELTDHARQPVILASSISKGPSVLRNVLN